MKDVYYLRQQNAGVIHFNRAPANAYNLAFQQQFAIAIKEANSDPLINAVIIKSTSPKFFCAGADIKEFQSNSTMQNQTMVDLARANLDAIEASDKIYIAQLSGHTMGGGLEIALACDVRVASSSPYLIGMSEIKLGLIPGNGGTQRLTRLVGVSKAMDLLLTGDNISAQYAHQIGLINTLIDCQELKSALDDHCLSLANTLANGPAKAIAATKRCIYGAIDKSIDDGLALERNLADALSRAGDAQEGFLAFVEKRQPVYSD
jgi:enoyl-CoA hydratase/carnithine racemase